MFSEEFDILFNIIKTELNVSKSLVISSSRKRELVEARRIIYFIAKSNSKLSLAKIGKKLGGRDHATILSALRKHKDLYETDKSYAENFDKVNFKFLSSNIVSNKITTTIKQLNLRKKTITKYIDEQISRINKDESSRTSNLKIGLFMGSFNPIHNGHMMIANSALHSCDLDEVWFVVSPQSPDKVEHDNMLGFEERVELLSSSIMTNPSLKICDIERELPKPSYTVNTIEKLIETYPNYTFSLVIGSDNLENIHKWKDSNKIVSSCKICYFKRPSSGDKHEENAKLYNAERIKSVSTLSVSSTKIRNVIKSGESIETLRYLLPDECLYIIEQNKYYK